MRTSVALPLAAAVAAAAAQWAPGLTAFEPVRRRATPGLAGQGAPGHVALTFDDGPVPASTPAFLDRLAQLGWRATFFMLGQEVRRAPGLAAEVAAAGHEVAVHGDQHRNLLRRPPAATVDDLRRARDSVAWATGAGPAWFRPPYGLLSGTAAVAARRLGLRPVLWTTEGRDWRAEATPGTIVADISAHLAPGGTILLHDYAASGSWRATLAALPRLAELLHHRGLAAGPLADHGLTPPSPPVHPHNRSHAETRRSAAPASGAVDTGGPGWRCCGCAGSPGRRLPHHTGRASQEGIRWESGAAPQR
jgi:peptidoglycan/xylan/chitin deacetylase (PgdA/CDA1 family)